MTAKEITNLIEDISNSLPDRMTGNEVNSIIADRISSLAMTDRAALLESLRQYLSFRVPPSRRTHEHAIPETGLWMALHIGRRLCLTELIPNVESLLKDVIEKKALDPIDELSVTRSLNRLKESSPSISVSNRITV